MVMVKKRPSSDHYDLFDGSEIFDDQQALANAELELLDLADYVYAHTSLKPISKTLFLISRCLGAAKLGGPMSTASDLCSNYRQIRSELGTLAPSDDFDFDAVVAECESHVPHVLKSVKKVCRLTEKSDGLGLVFNTLLRGKFEGGEGMGTFLTPEEVVFPMVDMLFKVAEKDVERLSEESLLFGDVCGGTGRFVYAIARRLEHLGFPREKIESTARLFDQSQMAVDLGRLNFLFEGMKPTFAQVGDSLTAPEVSALRSRFLLLATNPPFGACKYRWNEGITEELPNEVLAAVGMTRRGDSADPSELFVFRNLDLLAPGGILAIVLPDGVLQSDDFKKALLAYERSRSTGLHIAAVVSLPSVTFSLGGTVAKTSFVIVQKSEEVKDHSLYLAVAHHVGFLKRGKKRGDDLKGNDLIAIAEEFGAENPGLGQVVGCWRDHESLIAARLMHTAANGDSGIAQRPLSDAVKMIREFDNGGHEGCERFHISVLDVDATGLIDIIAATKNKPITKGLVCKPGDILISCMNPKIWRVAVVPNLPGSWSCSAEFVVLRPKRSEDTWTTAIALHHPRVAEAVQAMAKGTSSSRQRVPKGCVLTVDVPELGTNNDLLEYVRWREEFYKSRLRESRAYDAVHDGEKTFTW
jgi:type I restriction-modification system DNA methylase subunit